MAARFYIETSDDPLRPIFWSSAFRTVTIGRSPGNLVRIHDEQASRRHAAITRRFGRYFLRDLKSLNGVMVDGHIVTHAELQDNSRIRIGATVIRFNVDPESPPTFEEWLPSLPTQHVSLFCAASIALGVLGFWSLLFAIAAILLGGLAALNVKLRPGLHGFWTGVAGASLGGAAFAFHFVAGSIAPAIGVLDQAALGRQCRARLAAIYTATERYRAENGSRPPTLAELYPKYTGDPSIFCCPAAEAVHGKRSAAAAYQYRPTASSQLWASPWIVRDASPDFHRDAGYILFADGQVRGLNRREFAQSLRESGP